MAAPVVIPIMRFLLEWEEDDDFKELALGQSAQGFAKAVWNQIAGGVEGKGMVNITLTDDLRAQVRQAGQRLLVKIKARQREPLLSPSQANSRTCYFGWPSREPFFVKTLARKIQAVLDDEPRRDRLEQLYALVDALKTSPAWNQWVDTVGEYKEGHPSDYARMTDEDIDFWLEQVKRFQ